MKRIKLYIILQLLVSMQLIAQELSVKIEREINLSILDILDTYETSSKLRSDNDIEDFIQLFSSPDLQIFNDLMGLSPKRTLSVTEYVSTLKNNADNIRVYLKDITKGTIEDGTNEWLVPIDFKKSISYSNHCGILLSASEYYGTDYSMHAVFAIDKENRTCTIKELSGRIDSNQEPFPEEYTIFQKTGNRLDSLVMNNGTLLTYNRFGQALLPPNYHLHCADDDIHLKIEKKNEACNIIQLQYRPKHWRIKPRFEFSLNGFHKMDNKTIGDAVGMTSSEKNFGIDVGYVLPWEGAVKLGFFTGVALSMSNVDFKKDLFNYHYDAPSEADLDGDTYTRYYELSNIHQEIKFTDLMMPLYLDLEYRVNRWIAFFADLGVRGYYNLSNSISSEMDLYSYGIYPQYQNLRIDESWLNNFGRYSLNNAALDNQKLDLKFALDAMFGIGTRISVYGPLAIELGLGYQIGLLNNYNGPFNLVNATESEGNRQNQLVTYTVYNGNSVRNLIESSEKLKHNSLKLNLGIIIKL